MQSLTPYEYERLLISYMLVFKEAPNYVLPDLTFDKFIYSTTGRFDGRKDHREIWSAITHVHMVDKLPITASTVASRMGTNGNNTEILHYLGALETSFHQYYRIREFEPAELMHYAEMVDKSGVVYQAAARSWKVAKVIENPEEFSKIVNQIPDVTEWLREYMGVLGTLATPKTEGYSHISESVDKAKALADRVYGGEQVMLLPVGMPSLTLAVGKLIILTGESNSGKSVVAHQISLGIAIGLKRYGIKGCVAVNSLEEREEPFTLKLAGMLAGVDMYKFQYGNGITDKEKCRLDRALEYVADLPIYLDTTNLLSTSVMDYRLTGLHASDKGPVHFMSLDYLTRLNLGAEDAGNEEQAINKAIHHCDDIVRTTGMTMLVISQVTQGNSGDSKARIAGADGTRGSRSSKFAADAIWEWWNPIESIKAGNNISIPDTLNKENPWLLNPKTRFGPKLSPIPFGWQPEYTRIFDLELNRQGNNEIVLFSHPMPSFDQEYGF